MSGNAEWLVCFFAADEGRNDELVIAFFDIFERYADFNEGSVEFDSFGLTFHNSLAICINYFIAADFKLFKLSVGEFICEQQFCFYQKHVSFDMSRYIDFTVCIFIYCSGYGSVDPLYITE